MREIKTGNLTMPTIVEEHLAKFRVSTQDGRAGHCSLTLTIVIINTEGEETFWELGVSSNFDYVVQPEGNSISTVDDAYYYFPKQELGLHMVYSKNDAVGFPPNHSEFTYSIITNKTVNALLKLSENKNNQRYNLAEITYKGF